MPLTFGTVSLSTTGPRPIIAYSKSNLLFLNLRLIQPGSVFLRIWLNPHDYLIIFMSHFFLNDLLLLLLLVLFSFALAVKQLQLYLPLFFMRRINTFDLT